VPFGQIHGHLSAFRWNSNRWDHLAPTELRRTAMIDREARHLTVRIGGKPFTGIDPGLGPHSPRGLVPLVLAGRMPIGTPVASRVDAMVDTLLEVGAEY